MPAVAAAEPRRGELARALDEAGEKEIRRMIRAARMARGRFHLFPVESDFTPALRAAFLERLRDDLAAIGLRLRVVTLTPACWNVLAVLEQEAPIVPGDLVMLTGLEATPGIVREAGAKPQRPPALSVLNQSREILRQQISAPLFVWCPAYVYTALLEYAPDFFDQYTAKFKFMNAVPSVFTEAVSAGLKFSIAVEDSLTDKPTLGAQAAVDFYRKQVDANPTPTYERADALLDLVLAQIGLPASERAGVISEAKTCAEEAIQLLAKRRTKRLRFRWALGQVELGMIYGYFTPDDQNTNQRDALNCYKRALRVFTELSHPTNWAVTQRECGVAYLKMKGIKGDANLLNAITCYEAALRVFTEVDSPYEWAITQFNLGIAYSKITSGDKVAHLQYALTCYQEALRILTESEHRFEWAMVHSCLGADLLALSVSDEATYLPQAIVSLKAASRVYTETKYPELWAVTNYGLALGFVKDGDIDNAQDAYKRAAQGFAAIGDMLREQQMEAQLQEFAASSTPHTHPV